MLADWAYESRFVILVRGESREGEGADCLMRLKAAWARVFLEQWDCGGMLDVEARCQDRLDGWRGGGGYWGGMLL